MSKVESGKFSKRPGPCKVKKSRNYDNKAFIEDVFLGQKAFIRRDDEENVKELITYTIRRIKQILDNHHVPSECSVFNFRSSNTPKTRRSVT